MLIISYKIFENVQKSKKILNELDIPLDNEDYIKLKDLVGKHTGYLGKFTEWIFKDEYPFNQIEMVFNELSKVKLDKDINQFESPEKLYDYLTEFKINQRVNQVFKSLPSGSRRLVNDKLHNLIKLNIQYSDSIKDFYSKKGGRYKGSDKLYNDTESLINNLSGGWDVESIKYKPEELVYKDGSTLILHIKDYDRSCDLGSQHWCISTDKSMWKDYTEGFNKQYFIYDFSKSQSDKKSMIGVTINTSGLISACYYKDDSEGDRNEILNEYGQYLNPYSKEYIKGKIDINSIIEVSQYGFLDEVKRLIQQGVDPSDAENQAIRLSSMYGHLDVVKLLLKDPRVDPSDDSNEAIRLASENGHTDVVKELLKDPRVDPSDKNNFAIRSVSFNGYVEVVKELLKDPRVDPSDLGNGSIRWSSENGHIDVVRELLKDPRVSPSDMNNYAIRLSSEEGHIEVVRELLKDPRVDPSDIDNFAIRYSSELGHVEVVRELLKDDRVKSSLSKEDLIKYENQVK